MSNEPSPSSMQPERLFVYGTLAPGRADHELLESVSGTWEAATLRGTLRAAPPLAEQARPGLVLTEDGDEVEASYSPHPILPSIGLGAMLRGRCVRALARSSKGNETRDVEAYIAAIKT